MNTFLRLHRILKVERELVQRETLATCWAVCVSLPEQMGLELKQERIGRVSNGVPFLGCTMYERHRELNRRSRLRWVKRIGLLDRLLAESRLSEAQAQKRAMARCAWSCAPACVACSLVPVGRVRTRRLQSLHGRDGHAPFFLRYKV